MVNGWKGPLAMAAGMLAREAPVPIAIFANLASSP
jgi:hypothetical protein